MQQIRATLTPFTIRSGSMRVSHTDCRLPRGLDHGEHVLVHDPATGIDHAAVVADVDFELEDTTYRLELGSRITTEQAAQWSQPDGSLPTDWVTTSDIVELLGALRKSSASIETAFAELIQG
jgi:hypothetical protein